MSENNLHQSHVPISPSSAIDKECILSPKQCDECEKYTKTHLKRSATKIKRDFPHELSPIKEISADISEENDKQRSWQKTTNILVSNDDGNGLKIFDMPASFTSWNGDLFGHDETQIAVTRKSGDFLTSPLSDMAVDDISFYDDLNQEQQQMQASFQSSPFVADRLLSPEGSPHRFQIVPRQKLCLSQQKELILNKLRIIEVTPCKSSSNSSCSTSSSSSLSRMVKNKNRQNASPATTTTTVNNFRIFTSVDSESMDDDYMELFDMESIDDDQNHHMQPFGDETNLPSNLNSLISGHIKSNAVTPEIKRPSSVRRCLLESNNQQMRLRTALFEPKTPEFFKISEDIANTTTPTTTSFSSRSISPKTSISHHIYCFKRPEPPSIVSSPVQSKRFCSIDEKENNHSCSSSGTSSVSQPASPMNHRKVTFSIRPPLRQTMSMDDSDIMSALARCDNNFGGPDLIGDFSKPFCLPLIDGRHRDLKSVSCDTVAQLIRGQFDDCVASYTIIDCRYPYEFEGGHIRGAKNLYTQEQIIEEFIKNNKTESVSSDATSTTTTTNATNNGPKRNILVFHCEFSSERGPKLSRFLRSNDRESNTDSYPILDYPEIYLLHNGYKEFYEKHSDLCDPSAYRPMLEPSYNEAYKYFRAKSKIWNGGDGKGIASRMKKSRSRLVL